MGLPSHDALPVNAYHAFLHNQQTCDKAKGGRDSYVWVRYWYLTH